MIAVVGATGVGKSATINAILGGEAIRATLETRADHDFSQPFHLFGYEWYVSAYRERNFDRG
jgi:ABC-type glutathione transport system ATPase component